MKQKKKFFDFFKKEKKNYDFSFMKNTQRQSDSPEENALQTQEDFQPISILEQEESTQSIVSFFNEEDRKKNLKYDEILMSTQGEISKKHSLAILNKNDIDAKNKVKNYISHFLTQQNYAVKDMSHDELVDKIFHDMVMYSFLTSYLINPDVEEININSWDQIVIYYSNGDIKISEETFLNEKHASDVIVRLLRESSMQIDGSVPSVVGHLSNYIRITANISPVIDVKKGVSASIRIINPKKLRKEDFLKNETMTEEMFDFLGDIITHKKSALVAGDTGSGKTTLLGGVLYDIDNSLRKITIEQDMREFDLDKEENGKQVNNVIYLKTRMTKNGSNIENINQEKLLEISLTMNPDIIVVGEIKNIEANASQEASRTGHAVVGTIHSNDCRSTYDRMCTLCQKKYALDYSILYNLVTEAFPIIVYCEKIAKNKRKVMEITECLIDDDGNRTIQTLYRYKIKDYVKDEHGRNIDVVGEFEKVNEISSKLQTQLFYKGMSKERLKKYVKEVTVDEY